MRYGIPNFKLNKNIIDRRLSLLEEEGIIFKPDMEIGKTISGNEILDQFDAVCIAIGAGHPRDINPKGRELKGIYFAHGFPFRNKNRKIMGDEITNPETITAKDKYVLVIGGGDTGSDCVGTSIRQGAKKLLRSKSCPNLRSAKIRTRRGPSIQMF